MSAQRDLSAIGYRLSAIVLGYGSPLLGDDAAGPRVVAAVARWNLRGVWALAAHQLTPELAEPLARARLAIFVDARVGRGGVRVRPIHPADRLSALEAHLSTPGALLALAQVLYGQVPRAWLISLPAQQFDLGAPLSPHTRRALPVARQRVRALISTGI
jgi:hydrogenase maturation protease